LFAQKYKGKFILRIEDTDKERSTKEFEQDILNGLEWLGLSWDEFFRQSERGDIYKDYLKKMLESGEAYLSKEEVQEEGQRSEVIRFKNPNKKIKFDDLIRGEVEFDTTELKDFVIAKSVDEPLYHLAVVVDDHEMGVTHVIRGEDHISNTPRQILIQEAIGARRPTYAHLPLILDSNRKKLSKREHGEAVWVDFYKNQDILPGALLNYLALLGWNPGTEQEIFTLEDLIKAFDINKAHKGGAIFDIKKLEWVNKEHLKFLSEEERLQRVMKEFDTTSVPVLQKEKIHWKDSSPEEARKHLEKLLEIISNNGDKEEIMKYANGEGLPAEPGRRGSVLWPLRYALSGQEKSPDPLTLFIILGQEESKKRIQGAIELLK